MRRALSKFRRCDAGAAAVEFSIVGLILVLVSLAVIDFGRGFHARNQMAFAADIGARLVLTDGEIANDALALALRDAYQGVNPEALTVEVTDTTVDGTAFKVLTLEYPLQLRWYGLEASALTLNVVRRVPLI